jgi:hypothetical protein
MLKHCLAFTICCSIIASCNNKKTENTLFQKLDNTGINFQNNITDQKEMNIFKYRNFYNGGGVGIGDINNDGLPDVFFTANMGNNALFLNKGNFQFEDISATAGFGPKEQWSTGVTMVDINHDGWLDIYVCNAGHLMNPEKRKNQLFINNHNNTFSDSATAYGLDNNGYSTHASFFDYDMDGDLDCFIVNNSPIPVNTLNYMNARNTRAENSPVADFLKGGGDHLYRNDNGKFVEVSEQAGIHGSLISFGLGVTVGDVNNDGWPDVYVSNDFFERDYLYINQKNGTFKDDFEQCIAHNSIAAMGTDMADVNNDGYPDIFTTEMLPDDDYRLKSTTAFESIDVFRLKQNSGFHHQFMQNSLLLNNANGKFKEIAHFAGVQASDWSWGELMFDADNDGYTDIYVCNGIVKDLTNQDFIDFFANFTIQKMVLTGKKEEIKDIIDKMPSQPIPNKMFHNQGNLRFKEIGKNWGLDAPSFSNGAAYSDLDNDGDLDLVINNLNQPAFVFKNNAREQRNNHYIGFNIKGLGNNSFAVGTKIKVFANNQILSKDIIPARGFQSSIDYTQIIGIGKLTSIDSVQILWPNLKQSVFSPKQMDSIYTIQQGNISEHPFQIPATTSKPIFTAFAQNFDKHQENEHVDFYAERMLPRLLSREGPATATADINGDGKMDIYIGAAKDLGGQIYLQQNNGSFKKQPQPSFEAFRTREDVSASFFDADNDGDADLFIGSGGNDRLNTEGALNHRLFLNNGKGIFSVQPNAFPDYAYSCSVAVPMDFDQDGDLDLFVGSRNTPYKYGVSPKSYIYVNDGKAHFTDQTGTLSKDFDKLGMVTAAVWGTLSANQQPCLVVVGDWMYPKIFQYQQGKFIEQTSDLQQYKGWWQTVVLDDIDGDGNNDLILGNAGENSYLKPTPSQPVQLWLNDFDGNGTLDKVLTHFIESREVPVFLKQEMQEQMPFIKKENLRYEDYAKKTIQELFTEKQRASATVLTCNYSSSIIAWGLGKGKFNVQRLPDAVQFSCVNAIQCVDVNRDGKKDIVLAGNQSGFLPQFGKSDASFGSILINNGNRQLNLLSDQASGLDIEGEVRHIANLTSTNAIRLLFVRNNDLPVMVQVKD